MHAINLTPYNLFIEQIFRKKRQQTIFRVVNLQRLASL